MSSAKLSRIATQQVMSGRITLAAGVVNGAMLASNIAITTSGAISSSGGITVTGGALIQSATQPFLGPNNVNGVTETLAAAISASRTIGGGIVGTSG